MPAIGRSGLSGSRVARRRAGMIVSGLRGALNGLSLERCRRRGAFGANRLSACAIEGQCTQASCRSYRGWTGSREASNLPRDFLEPCSEQRMSGFEFNKIAGALLFTALVVIGARVLTNHLYGVVEHGAEG